MPFLVRLTARVFIVVLLLPGVALAQADPRVVSDAGPAAGSGQTVDAPLPPDQATPVPSIWREFVARVAVGSELHVRLASGERFRATRVRADDSGVLLLPKTRVPVPVQAVRYDAITSLEPARKGGIGAGKAVAIGVGTGVAAFWGMMAIAFAVWGD